eukprot:3473528-Pyramimonas_sp.AAC.3
MADHLRGPRRSSPRFPESEGALPGRHPQNLCLSSRSGGLRISGNRCLPACHSRNAAGDSQLSNFPRPRAPSQGAGARRGRDARSATWNCECRLLPDTRSTCSLPGQHSKPHVAKNSGTCT